MHIRHLWWPRVGRIIDPRVAERALTYALNVISEDGSDERRAQMTNRLDALDRECRNLSTAIARGGDLDALLVELQAREQERVSIRTRLSVLEADARTMSRAALRTRLSAYLADMKALLTGPDVAQAQGVLKKLIAGRLTFNPQADGSYAFKGTGTVEPVLVGLVPRYTECGVPRRTGRSVFDTEGGVPNIRRLEPRFLAQAGRCAQKRCLPCWATIQTWPCPRLRSPTRFARRSICSTWGLI
jgi:hypothetical protein